MTLKTNKLKITIRTENNLELSEIRLVHNRAFGGLAEGRLVEEIRASLDFVPELSLVAEQDGRVIGHILFSKVDLTGDGVKKRCLSLAPVAVIPEMQGHGVGASLINTGIREARALDFDCILVLGDPDYYQRFGFARELAQQIDSAYSGEHYMGLELIADSLSLINHGQVEYPAAFGAV